jgi:biotin operon repressor
MVNGNHRFLLYMFKALADESRLSLISWLSKGEYKVHQLGDLVGLSEPTVSHHLSKLRAVGLVNLREEGNQRFYRLNRERLEQFKEFVGNIENLAIAAESDEAWIDALPFSAEDKKTLRNCTFNGRLRQIPSKEKNLLVVLRWLASKFEGGRTYTEPEVNAIIQQAHEDYATLRRDLVDFGFLRRERAGSKYWLTPEDETI